ncbi:ribonuclease H-like domain-containing protein [Mycena olivaceomarginata]|nr:ribonuclease H-like domain-containing protein [Mycena olivaceomarginata]
MHPLQKLNESVAVARLRRDAVCVLGDLNGRTGCRVACRIVHPQRFSLDTTVNTQGRAILRLAGDHNLRILNGDLQFGNGSWGWTYMQERKVSKKRGQPGSEPQTRVHQSVLDYALCDVQACTMVQSFETYPVDPKWSDHAPIVLRMTISDLPAETNPGKAYLQNKLRESDESTAYLDVLMRETLASKKNAEERRAAFFGPFYDPDVGGLKVYTDGSCFNNGAPDARAGAGVYFGPSNDGNVSLRVTGKQTNNRGELLAILYCLSVVPAYRRLDIYTDSEHAARSIVYWAPKHAEAGWKCANGDLLKILHRG